MSFQTLAYKIGKRYGRALDQVSGEEFPELSGHLTDFLTDAEIDAMPELMGEHVIGYTSQGVRHFIHVYFDERTYEMTGTPMNSDDYGLFSDTHQSQD